MHIARLPAWARPVATITVLGALLLLMTSPAAGGAPIVVNSTNDPGDAGCTPMECTLREAMDAAGPGDSIHFDIDGCGGVCTIALSSALPEITGTVEIDATTQDGYSGTPVVVLDGTAAGAGPDQNGFRIDADDVVIRGFRTENFLAGAIHVLNVSGALIELNEITGNDGMNGVVALQGQDHTFRRNTLTGNTSTAVFTAFIGSAGHTIEDNTVTGNDDGGIEVSGPGITIAGNTVSGNADTGIAAIASGGADGLVLTDNAVEGNGGLGMDLAGGGLTVTGNAVTGNGGGGYSSGGIAADLSSSTVSGNTISDNPGRGFRLRGDSNEVTGNEVTGNEEEGIVLYGTGFTVGGNTVSGNGGAGVRVAASANVVIGGASGANVITGNGGPGVVIEGVEEGGPSAAVVLGGNVPSVGITISGNSILENGDLGIDLGEDGNTANDPGDSDTGANNLQNHPVLTSASSSSGSIAGTLDSTPGTQFRIEFFANHQCDPSGAGEGDTYLGSLDVTTAGDGLAAFNFDNPMTLSNGESVTATATDNGTGDTSEFSPCVTVTTGAIPTPTPTPVGTPTLTPSATPTPAPTPTTAPGLTQGDVDCDEDVDSVDALKQLRHVAALSVSQDEPCPDLGTEAASKFGDVDCDNDVDSVDALKVLRHVAALPVSQSEPCVDVGGPL